ncbi:hypothetical protein MKX03_025591 [Papaver bracteatum]|nr:hypothetical protein MKX03_025591 [Papaver bracteatum]
MALYSILSSNSHLHFSVFSFIIITILFILPGTATSSTSFDFSTFSPDDPRLYFENDASIVGNRIELNKNSTGINSVGRVTYKEAIQLWDPFNGRLADFVTHFSFLIERLNDTSYGDGIAFFLTPFKSKIPPNSGGGFLGLMSSNEAEKNFTTNETVAVEFDTFQNTWDFSPDHVGININSIRSVANVSLGKDSMKNGDIAKAWVNYNATMKNLSVVLTYEHLGFCMTSGLYYIVDLRKVLPEWVTVGFSAASGTGSENHKIISWQFNCKIKNRKDINTVMVMVVNVDAVAVQMPICLRRQQSLLFILPHQNLSSILVKSELMHFNVLMSL